MIGIFGCGTNFHRPYGPSFSVDFEIDNEDAPKRGDVVTFTYDNFVSVPINPRILRVREDMSWAEVLLNSAKDNQQLQSFQSSLF